jgi:hypothetical protein
MGVFSLPDFEGNVALLGVTEPEAALDAVVRQLEASGSRVLQRQPTGLVYLERLQEGPLGAFVDRGYLYLVVPDSPEEEEVTHEGGTVDRPGSLERVEKVRARIAALSGPGLSELPLVGELRAKGDPGLAYLFARPTGADVGSGFRGLWGALQVGPGRAVHGSLRPRRHGPAALRGQAGAHPPRCWRRPPRAPWPR